MQMSPELTFLGNTDLWTLRKTALLCSMRFSAGSVLKSYDWATEMIKENRCVISGFHSKLEKDVCDLLLRGNKSVIWVLARSMFKRTPPKLKSHIEAGRVLIVSQFPPGNEQRTRELATKRNQFVVDNADEIVFAHIYKGGMLDNLKIRDGIKVKVLDRE